MIADAEQDPRFDPVSNETGPGRRRRGGHRDCVACEIREGLPTLGSRAWSYYVSHRGGQPMLVLDRKPGERIRINDTTDIVVLSVRAGQVELGIEHKPDAEPHREI